MSELVTTSLQKSDQKKAESDEKKKQAMQQRLDAIKRRQENEAKAAADKQAKSKLRYGGRGAPQEDYLGDAGQPGVRKTLLGG